ncbi:uncharacterized protein LOC121676935 [Arvicola amphibius]|uniref:uncharacterized protein LOC121676935 n=1 Tax=Arvicola amphibius TaxID=1047088 RepID=UPI001C09DD6F|nr:uncharacterized protein LOC121676935 [Arvicola amphibius]
MSQSINVLNKNHRRADLPDGNTAFSLGQSHGIANPHICCSICQLQTLSREGKLALSQLQQSGPAAPFCLELPLSAVTSTSDKSSDLSSVEYTEFRSWQKQKTKTSTSPKKAHLESERPGHEPTAQTPLEETLRLLEAVTTTPPAVGLKTVSNKVSSCEQLFLCTSPCVERRWEEKKQHMSKSQEKEQKHEVLLLQSREQSAGIGMTHNGYGTRFKMRVSDPQIQSPSQHCTPLFKGLSDSEIQSLSWSPPYSMVISHQETDEKGERTKLSRKHVVPAHKTCTGGVRQKNVFKAIGRLRFSLKEMIEDSKESRIQSFGPHSKRTREP